MIGPAALIAFLATVPAANWMIGNVGTCYPGGPCVVPVPVGFGLSAPSGVLLIGAALVLRDLVHRTMGWQAAFAAVCAGTVVSLYVAPPSLVLASSVAFFLSELADLAVYQPLYRRRLIAAVVLSGLAGAVVDSVLFLWLAFGDLTFLAGNVLGKVWASLVAVPVIALSRRGVRA